MMIQNYQNEALNTDLYQLTMAAGYHSQKVEQTASFELYVRRLPPGRSYLVAAGLEQALQYLENLRFSADDIDWLRTHPAFQNIPETFFEMLANFRFEGNVWAIPEGTVFFPYEPILRITAPIIQAQLVETWLLSLINYQTSVASKAARISAVIQKHAAKVHFTDFGSRRAHGPHAGPLAARAAYLAGASGTSNVSAGKTFGIPVQGTAAHSWTMAFPDEKQAFSAYYEAFPENAILLVDTYDTLQGIRHAIETSKNIQGIRLDSGDFLSLSRQARAMLDDAGLKHAKIVVSGDMNEYKVHDLLQAGAPIDIFGIGTELVTSIDAPSLGGVYKLVETILSTQEKHYAIKLSSSKTSYPGCKQIWRQVNSDQSFAKDILGLAHEKQEGTPLIKQVMSQGVRIQEPESLNTIRNRCLQSLKMLPLDLKEITTPGTYPIEKSSALLDLFTSLCETKKEQHS